MRRGSSKWETASHRDGHRVKPEPRRPVTVIKMRNTSSAATRAGMVKTRGRDRLEVK